ncbi:exonuclease SbcCD subunit D C-terminal domain-containing protein [Hymenobacter sp. BRD128]|uniref:exonuclease SbcCD subunit D C-terminal domain-containing protein n=1 Tax=Hymenobacter sp. BRD128 TaxID=2675878 RepID=UPI001564FB82|nr:exonuclease SbcCD subunit D C-terminal domain-containing protein [Hymenobacter sp. BRD128]QKG56923.1 exonuclease SbcCD subunit D C-terminal domain-containing protein [Hymenobacter sp. BRD128]
MRVLHTADWHLGQHFLTGHERLTEQKAFLDWLLAIVQAEGVEALVLAGDVFDTTTPSHAAQELYYDFLVHLQGTGCRDVVIVGGNHDSPTLLNASRRLLRALRIHVVGGVPPDPAEQIIELAGASGRPGLVVCAVPFLRDRDLRLAVAGETPDERQLRIRDSIAGHYKTLSEHDLVRRLREHDVPVLATGHLYAAGGEAREGAERDVHIGGLGVVGAEHFPGTFDYVALGHLHRPQVVGGRPHIRYSGSPVPLSFTEADDRQQVLLLDFAGAGAPAITPLAVPVVRRLQRFHGELAEVEAAILAFDNEAFSLVAWADVVVYADEPTAEVQRRVQAVLKERRAHVLAPRGARHHRLTELPGLTSPSADAPLEHLHELTVEEVFSRRVAGLPPERAAALTATFQELRQLLAEADPLAWGGEAEA